MKIILNDILTDIGKWLPLSNVSEKVKESTPPQPRSPEDSERSIDALRQSVNEAGGHQAFLGFPDFLPFSFLETGMRTGRAVCCIFRRFSTPKSSGALMELMKKDIYMQKVVFKLFRELDAPSKDLTDPNNVEHIRQGIQKHSAIPYATGFLVGNNHLLTNYHLLVNHPDVSEANLLSETEVIAEMEAHFLYERDPLQRKSIEQKTPVIYKFKPDFHYAGSKPELDYILLQLESLNLDEREQSRVEYAEAGSNFWFLKLPTLEEPETILEPLSPEQIDRLKPTIDEANRKSRFGRIIGDKIPGEVVNIIQHSEGRPKEIVIYNNRVIKVYQDFLTYETDTEPGSSGSPLLNKNWQLIGLHQGAILNEDANEKIESYIGIRASSIVQDMTEQCRNPKDGKNVQPLQDFLDTWVNSRSQQNSLEGEWDNGQSQVRKSQIFIVAGRRDRNEVLPTQELADTERSLMLNLQQAIKAALEQQLGQQIVVYCNKIDTDLDSVIKEVNDNSGLNDIGIELVMNSSDNPEQSQLLLYYSNSKPLAREDAETLVKTYQADSTVKVFSDRKTYFGSLGFCNRVTIPSMVLYVGDVNQPEWVEDHLQTLATQLAEGLIAWHGAVGDRFKIATLDNRPQSSP